MPVRIRIRKRGGNDGKYRTGHKPLALLYSVALHGGLVALAFLPASVPQPDVYRSVVVQLEKDHKLIYYDFRKELPAVSPTNPTAKLTTPSPEALPAKQRIVAFPRAKAEKQLIYIPEPRIQLQSELKAPNLIAIETPPAVPLPDKPKPKPFQAPGAPKPAPAKVTALPSAPALAETKTKDSALSALLNKPTGPPPKQFVPPPTKSQPGPAVPSELPNAPTVATTAADKNSSLLPLLGKPVGPPPKKFTPPPSAKASASSAAPAQLPSAPSVGTGAEDKSSSVIAGLFGKPTGPPPKAFTPPSAHVSGSRGVDPALPAAPAIAGSHQTAAATVAIIGLNPAAVPQIPKPEGSRPARIDAGTPLPGATRAETGGGNSSINMPDVAIEGHSSNTPAVASRLPLGSNPVPPPTGLARPRPPQVLPSTPHVSVPQWPNTRLLPAAVEHHFQNRVVYITSIPSAQGDEDWIIWFAQSAAGPADPNIAVHPPIVLKSGALPPFAAHQDHGNGSIRLTGIIGKDGHLQAVTELGGGAADRELVEALETWLFGPARRNGIAFDADAVIEIPVLFGKLSLR